MTGASGLTVDMEQLWDLTTLLRLAATTVLYGLFLARFLSAFSNHGLRPAWTAGGVYTAILLFCLLIPYEMSASVAYLAAATGAFAVYIVLERGRTLIKLFACLTFEAVRRIASTAGSCAYIVLASYIVWPAHADPELQYRAFVVVCIADVAVQAITAYAALRIIVRRFPDPHGTLTAGEFGLLCVPPAVAIVTTQVLHALRQIIDYAQFSVDVEYLSLILAAAVIVSLGTTVVMFGKIREEQHKETNRELLEGQLTSMRDYIAQMERNDERTARLRHDLANHIETIRALQENGHLEDASGYAKRTYGELVAAQSALRTGNPVSDVILGEQQQYAQQHGVRYTADFKFPAGLDIDAFDLGIILHNAGQNAIEAAGQSEEPWVSIRSTVHRRTLLIDISNSCAGPVRLNPVTGLPDTTKSGEHGIGLRNITSAAEKYSGNVQATADPDMFTLSVLLAAPPVRN